MENPDVQLPVVEQTFIDDIQYELPDPDDLIRKYGRNIHALADYTIRGYGVNITEYIMPYIHEIDNCGGEYVNRNGFNYVINRQDLL